MTDRDRYLIEELEKRLYWYRDVAAREEFDEEEVDAICVMLQKLSPIEEAHMTKEEAYERVMLRVQAEEAEREKLDLSSVDNAGKKFRRTKRRDGKVSLFHRRRYRAAMLFIAGFGAALLSLNMVTYAREDKSLFTMILERVGVLEIVKDGDGEEILIDGEITTNTFYESWSDLDKEIKSKIIVPEYIPEEYSLYGIRYFDYNNREKVQADYYDKENKHLLISITLWEDNFDQYREMAIDEKGHILLKEYSDENTFYYEYEDEYICMVSMHNSLYRISGNIELEEMIKVRRGLDGAKK